MILALLGTLLAAAPAAADPVVRPLRADSVGVPCARGTVDVGVHRGYADGRAVRVRLCVVRSLPSTAAESRPGSGWFVPGARDRALVNSRVSRAVRDLIAAARARGLRPSATSAWRSMAHQQALCRADWRCRQGNYLYVARPGFSAHQLGVAIDVRGTSVRGRRTCGEGRASDPSSAIWRFLHRNAARFGFAQYAPESWHWDALRAADRCS